MKRDLAEIEIAVIFPRMIGNDGGRDHLEFTGAPAIQDVGQAVIGFRNQQHHPAAGGAVAHLPVHVKSLGDRRESGLQRRQINRKIGGLEYHAHEEIDGLDVVELLGVKNVLPIMGKECGDGRNDAGTIRTGQCHHVLMMGHGVGLIGDLKGNRNGELPLLYHPRCPCANPGHGAMMNKQQAKRC